MRLPMFPLEWVLLPGEELSLRIFEPRYTALVGDLLRSGDPRFGVVLIARGREVGGGEQRHDVGVVADIVHCSDLGSGRYALSCQIGQRIRVREWLVDDPYPRAEVDLWPDEPGEALADKQFRDLEERVTTLQKRIAESGNRWQVPGRNIRPDIRQPAAEPERHLYALACRVPMGEADRYAVLAASSVSQRIAALHDAIDTVSARIEFGSPR